jgi:hypothetical protein
MSNQPRTSKNKRTKKYYNNKSKSNKRNHKCRGPCDSCINININININGSGNTGTNCSAVNNRCNQQLAACLRIAGDNELGRFICGEADKNCFANAGCEPPAQGGVNECRAEVNDCTRECVRRGGEINQCITQCWIKCEQR